MELLVKFWPCGSYGLVIELLSMLSSFFVLPVSSLILCEFCALLNGANPEPWDRLAVVSDL
jgi:hypothetical protein